MIRRVSLALMFVLCLACQDKGSESDRATSVFEQAIAAGDHKRASRAVKQGADVNHRYPDGFTMLLTASRVTGDDNPTVKLMLNLGADPNKRAPDGRTALHFAAARGSAGNVRLMLDAGADPAIVDDAGKTAADYARENGHDTVLEALDPTEEEDGG